MRNILQYVALIICEERTKIIVCYICAVFCVVWYVGVHLRGTRGWR